MHQMFVTFKWKRTVWNEILYYIDNISFTKPKRLSISIFFSWNWLNSISTPFENAYHYEFKAKLPPDLTVLNASKMTTMCTLCIDIFFIIKKIVKNLFACNIIFWCFFLQLTMLTSESLLKDKLFSTSRTVPFYIWCIERYELSYKKCFTNLKFNVDVNNIISFQTIDFQIDL